jgi:hypothetical protein
LVAQQQPTRDAMNPNRTITRREAPRLDCHTSRLFIRGAMVLRDDG